MDLTFKALQEDFVGIWPASMDIENAEYTATLSYMGASADPRSDVGEYAADLAAGRLGRKNLILTCKPKISGRKTKLDIEQGFVVLRPMPVMPVLEIDEARHLVEDLGPSIGSAIALDEFITARFGPAG